MAGAEINRKCASASARSKSASGGGPRAPESGRSGAIVTQSRIEGTQAYEMPDIPTDLAVIMASFENKFDSEKVRSYLSRYTRNPHVMFKQ